MFTRHTTPGTERSTASGGRQPTDLWAVGGDDGASRHRRRDLALRRHDVERRSTCPACVPPACRALQGVGTRATGRRLRGRPPRHRPALERRGWSGRQPNVDVASSSPCTATNPGRHRRRASSGVLLEGGGGRFPPRHSEQRPQFNGIFYPPTGAASRSDAKHRRDPRGERLDARDPACKTRGRTSTPSGSTPRMASGRWAVTCRRAGQGVLRTAGRSPFRPASTTCSHQQGTICTVAGTGKAQFDGDGRPALDTSLYFPIDVHLRSQRPPADHGLEQSAPAARQRRRHGADDHGHRLRGLPDRRRARRSIHRCTTPATSSTTPRQPLHRRRSRAGGRSSVGHERSRLHRRRHRRVRLQRRRRPGAARPS